MKAKITLTKEQVNQLVEIEEKQLRAKFEKDLESIRKKYEIVEIDLNVQTDVRKTKKSKLTDEDFKKHLDNKKTLQEIADITNYNLAYLRKRKKQLIDTEK